MPPQAETTGTCRVSPQAETTGVADNPDHACAGRNHTGAEVGCPSYPDATTRFRTMTTPSFATLLAQRDAAAVTVADGYLFRHDGGAQLSPSKQSAWQDVLARADALNDQIRIHPEQQDRRGRPALGRRRRAAAPAMMPGSPGSTRRPPAERSGRGP